MVVSISKIAKIDQSNFYLNPPMNTPSIAAGLDGDEFGIVGASPTINSCHNACEDDLKYLRDRPKGLLLQILPH